MIGKKPRGGKKQNKLLEIVICNMYKRRISADEPKMSPRGALRNLHNT